MIPTYEDAIHTLVDEYGINANNSTLIILYFYKRYRSIKVITDITDAINYIMETEGEDIETLKLRSSTILFIRLRQMFEIYKSLLETIEEAGELFESIREENERIEEMYTPIILHEANELYMENFHKYVKEKFHNQQEH